MKFNIFFLAFFSVLVLHTQVVSATQVTVYGSEQFIRTTGSPNTFTDTFNSHPGAAKLIVLNGEQSGNNRISSAEISINGTLVLGSNDFNQQTYRLESPLALSETNQIEIKLKSKPGSYLTISITQEIPLTITFISPTEGDLISTNQITVTGQIEAAAQYVEMAVNRSHALVNGSFFLAPDIELAPGLNEIHAVAVDSYGNRTEGTITVNYAENTNGWIESQVSDEGGFAPLDSQLTIIPHIQGEINWDTAIIDSSGPGSPIVNRQSNTEYSLSFQEPGFYTVSFEVRNNGGNFFCLLRRICG